VRPSRLRSARPVGGRRCRWLETSLLSLVVFQRACHIRENKIDSVVGIELHPGRESQAEKNQPYLLGVRKLDGRRRARRQRRESCIQCSTHHSSISKFSQPRMMCRWLSISPGGTRQPFGSMIPVDFPASGMISCGVSTAEATSPVTATARAVGRHGRAWRKGRWRERRQDFLFQYSWTLLV
jgi:hypothetical protein